MFHLRRSNRIRKGDEGIRSRRRVKRYEGEDLKKRKEQKEKKDREEEKRSHHHILLHPGPGRSSAALTFIQRGCGVLFWVST